MSFRAKPLRPRKSTSAPQELLTSHDIKRSANHRGVPTVTPRRIVGTYTFSAPAGFVPTSQSASSSTPVVTGVPVPLPTSEPIDDSESEDDHHRPLHSEHYLKSYRQTDTWTLHVIPALIPIYLHLLRTTQSLTRPSISLPKLCTCGGKITTIVVVCVYFDGMSAFLLLLYRRNMLTFPQPSGLKKCGTALANLCPNNCSLRVCSPAHQLPRR